MKIKTSLLSIVMGIALSSGASADTYDTQWIAQCMMDNKDEGQATEVVQAYCECMNSQMSSNETRTVSEWEIANPQVAEACAKKAGWQ